MKIITVFALNCIFRHLLLALQYPVAPNLLQNPGISQDSIFFLKDSAVVETLENVKFQITYPSGTSATKSSDQIIIHQEDYFPNPDTTKIFTPGYSVFTHIEIRVVKKITSMQIQHIDECTGDSIRSKGYVYTSNNKTSITDTIFPRNELHSRCPDVHIATIPYKHKFILVYYTFYTGVDSFGSPLYYTNATGIETEAWQRNEARKKFDVFVKSIKIE